MPRIHCRCIVYSPLRAATFVKDAITAVITWSLGPVSLNTHNIITSPTPSHSWHQSYRFHSLREVELITSVPQMTPVNLFQVFRSAGISAKTPNDYLQPQATSELTSCHHISLKSLLKRVAWLKTQNLITSSTLSHSWHQRYRFHCLGEVELITLVPQMTPVNLFQVFRSAGVSAKTPNDYLQPQANQRTHIMPQYIIEILAQDGSLTKNTKFHHIINA